MCWDKFEGELLDTFCQTKEHDVLVRFVEAPRSSFH